MKQLGGTMHPAVGERKEELFVLRQRQEDARQREIVAGNRDYGKLMPSTIGISANKLKNQLNFNLILDVSPEKQGVRQFWTLTHMTIFNKLWKNRNILRSLLPTIYFNFHYLPFRQAVKLPILLYKPKLLKLKGFVKIMGGVKLTLVW